MAVPTGLQNLVELVEKIDSDMGSNKYPIVLVHGFSGWCQPLLGCFNYWGGFEDLPAALHESTGVPIILPTIGPFSSNWERACELYAQIKEIKGGSKQVNTGSGLDLPNSNTPSTEPKVNYGNHIPSQYVDSAKARACKTVVLGELPANWKWDENNPVHMICHSQGGNTVRLLIQLLSGETNELETSTKYQHNEYFPLGKNRQKHIKSVVTLGSPHRGTTITKLVDEMMSNYDAGARELITRLVVSLCFTKPRVYDLLLDHWGFYRLTEPAPESFLKMHERLKVRILKWWDSEYNGLRDNSIEGVTKLNNFAKKPSEHIYYFTMSFDATRDFPRQELSTEDLEMLPVNHHLTGNGLLFPGPFGMIAHLTSLVANIAHVTYNNIPGSPDDLKYANWMLEVMNNHSKALGYQLSLPKLGKRIPRPDMLPLLVLPSYGMSGLDSTAFGQDGQNDGIINTKSMEGPDRDKVKQIKDFPHNDISRADAKGCYWHLGRNHEMDHADQIGVFTMPETYKNVENMYQVLGKLLSSLPPNSS